MFCKVVCSEDGEVALPASAIVLDLDRSVYWFTCSCGAVTERQMDERIRALLASAGVTTVEQRVESFVSDLDASLRELLDH